MERLGFYYNMDTCVSCGACQMACKSENGLIQEENYRRVAALVYGPFSGSCNHCQEAACVKACPTGAMYKAADGTTQHDDGKCIGCGACMWNCPYGAITFSKSRGVTQKCTSCASRRARGEEPACVKACPTKSIRFGVLEETRADFPFLPDEELTQPNRYINPSKRLQAALAKAADEAGGETAKGGERV